MAQIIFRNLPGVATVERQLSMQFRDRLLDDEVEELPHLKDNVSQELFGITERDTFYWALPEAVRRKYGRTEWESNFDVLSGYSRDPNEHWHAFSLDLRCEEGRALHCLQVFGRQLLCALNSLHPKAVLTFMARDTSEAA